MGWPKFGKSDDKNDDQSKAEADALIERFAAVIDEKIKPFGETVTSLKTKWDSIEEEARKAGEPPPVKEEDLTAEQKQANRERALFGMTVQANARITEAECIEALSGQWSHLIPDFKKMAASTSIDVKARPDYANICNNAIDTLIGKAARSGGVRSDASGKFYIEDAASKTGGEDSPLHDIPTWQGDDRTESASDTLAKLKIDPKKFSEDLKAGRLN